MRAVFYVIAGLNVGVAFVGDFNTPSGFSLFIGVALFIALLISE